MTTELKSYYVVSYTTTHEYTCNVLAYSRLEAAKEVSSGGKEVRHVGRGESLYSGMEIGSSGWTLFGQFKTTPKYKDISEEYAEYLNSLNMGKGYED